MKLIYKSSSRAPVEVVEAGITVTPGEPVEIPAAIAKRLLEQSVWSRATKQKE